MNHFTLRCVYGAALAGTFSFELVRSMNKEIKTLDAKLKVSRELIEIMYSVIGDAEEKLAAQDPDIYEEFTNASKEKLEFFNVAYKMFI